MRTGIPCASCTQFLTDDPTRDGWLRCEHCKLEGPLPVMQQLTQLRTLAEINIQAMRARREKVVELDVQLQSCGARECVVKIGTVDKACECSIVALLDTVRVRSQQLQVAMGEAPAAPVEAAG